MSPRTGVEAEAIERLTEGVEPTGLRTILVQCLSGEITPSGAITRMLKETGDVSIVRGAIDEVTRRAATISRTNDMLVHDRVDDLTQLFVENEAGWQDTIRSSPADLPPTRSSFARSSAKNPVTRSEESSFGKKPEGDSDQLSLS